MTDTNKYGLIVVGGGITGLISVLIWALNQDVKKNRV